MRLHLLADELRAALAPAGIRVIEVAGWRNAGRDFPNRGPRGAVEHWTAGPRTGYAPSLKTVTNGRPGVPKPLANVYQARNLSGPDDVYVIAAGVANHAGEGGWRGLVGNSSVLGLEIEWSGPAESFPQRRRDVADRIMAVLCDLTGGDAAMVCQHREWAPDRKIDTNLNGADVRFRVAQLNRPGPAPGPTPPEDPMATSPGACVIGPDRYAALHGLDHRAWLKIGAGPWAAFDGTGGRPNSALDAGSSPCLVTNPAGRATLLVSGANRKVHWTNRNAAGVWAAWDAFDGTGGLPDATLAPGSSPAATLTTDGRWRIVVTGTDNKLYELLEQTIGGVWSVTAIGGAVA